jgi:hypothetical protein
MSVDQVFTIIGMLGGLLSTIDFIVKYKSNITSIFQLFTKLGFFQIVLFKINVVFLPLWPIIMFNLRPFYPDSFFTIIFTAMYYTMHAVYTKDVFNAIYSYVPPLRCHFFISKEEAKIIVAHTGERDKLKLIAKLLNMLTVLLFQLIAIVGGLDVISLW